MGEGVVFSVANPLDLALQELDLMANVLVVEVRGVGPSVSMLWFRFDPSALAARGSSVCELFSDNNADGGGSGCGWLVDRKRM